MPTPRPTFWVIVSPLSSADGASGFVAAEVAEETLVAVDALLDGLVEVDMVEVWELDAERVGLDDCNEVCDASDCVDVTESPDVWGVDVGHAVSGPNLTIR
jgi:hypothetical protein